MKVLLVEDDALLAREIAQALRRENFAVDIAVNGEDGQHLGETENYDAAMPRIEASGEFPPDGLEYHVAFNSGGSFRVTAAAPFA